MPRYDSNAPGEIREIFLREGDHLARAGFREPDLSTAPEGFDAVRTSRWDEGLTAAEAMELLEQTGGEIARSEDTVEGSLPKPPLWVTDAQDLVEGEQPPLKKGQLLVQRQSLVAEYDKEGKQLPPRNLGPAVVTLRTEGEQ